MIIPRFLKQVCVYWPPVGPEREGQRAFGPAVELKCRWSFSEQAFVTSRGDAQVAAGSNALVLLQDDVEEQGVLWLSSAKTTDPAGTALAQLASKTVPFDNTHAYAIQKFVKIPSVSANEFSRKAYL